LIRYSKAKTHYSFNELTGAVESRVYNSEGTLVRYNGKHLGGNNSQYQTNIVLQLSDNETVYNRFATDCAKEVISAAVPLEEGLSVSQPTKAIRPCSVCSRHQDRL
jgi:hypothetical protein